MEYKQTLNMNKSGFPMRGGLPMREPDMLKHWQELDLYNELLKKNEGKPRFALHDGPPFSNGALHMGHALNKCIKDFMIRSAAMRGYYTPYIPGWDNHGMPIESAIIKKNKLNHKAMPIPEFRSACHDFAQHYIDVQMEGFKRLGVVADWEHPYKTMAPSFEAEEVKVFGAMYKKGYIYKGLKPVYWCYHDETALAEAEIEYQDDPCTTVYVKFPLHDDQGRLTDEEKKNLSFVIWTTTIWTLPGNLAIALHPDESYAVVKNEDNGEMYIVAEALVEKVMAVGKIEHYSIVETHPGNFYENMLAQHPFLPKTSRLVLADYVTMDSGTGCVHTAPGFGADDYQTCRRYGMDMVVPVNDQGRHTDYAGKYAGMLVEESNPVILKDMQESGALFASEQIVHSYPHCWRCKKPIIFRATPQWFCSVESFKDAACAACDDVRWLPAWGIDRMKAMIRERADWCISRQRTWGVPLPVFFDENGKAVLDAALVRKIADMVEKHGSNIWFELSDEDLCERLGLPKTWKKGKDTLDVWIDSGSSHMAVMDNRPGLDAPADLYLEATDQHRGWFQSSLMLSVAWRGKAPYKAVMTHGFVVDKDTGKKTSKSDAKSGKPIDAAYYYDKYGADIVRLWAASVDWQNEVPFGEDLFKQVTEPYRRLRNTLRILLGNISGFDFAAQAVAPEHMPLLDRWILERLNAVIRETLKAYEAYDFRKAFSAINQFCTSDLSALYVDTTKDRLYCDSSSSVRRRATQTAMTIIFKALCRLLAPILAFTADEAWEYAGYEGSVHEQDFPAPMPEYDTQEATSVISRLQEIRSVIQVAIEEQVKAKVFSKNNEASITLTVPVNESEDVVALLEDRAFATEFFIIADLDVKTGPELAASAAKTEHAMCPRCRRYEPAAEGGDVCERCAEVLS